MTDTHESPGPFAVHRPDWDSGDHPEIVLFYDDETETGYNWEEIQALPDRYPANPTDERKLYWSVPFLQEAIYRMTGSELPVVSRKDISHGIVLTTLEFTPRLKRRGKIRKALGPRRDDRYSNREAYFIRSSPRRLLIVANTVDGLAAAIPALLESVGYEVLGMGPNWTHVPDYRDGLAFNVKLADRPSYYIRRLWATSGQDYGVGTIHRPDPPLVPPDEPVSTSYLRWLIGTRMFGRSMPLFPGHALHAYHGAVIDHMKAGSISEGFLASATQFGLDVDRPEASAENESWLWINSDAEGSENAGMVFVSAGGSWREQNPNYLILSLDLSVLYVRELILEALKARSDSHFLAYPDDPYIHANDPEDGGGYARFSYLSNTTWYPDYLVSEGLPFGRPYVLHEFKGLDQPLELWDPGAASDTVFGFANWLLFEYDKWIDSLPAAERLTSSGKSKKELIRISQYSYNFHDVPPNFNLDPRIRVMIAGFAKNRGRGKWTQLKTHVDVAQAFALLLPEEPGADYRILSYAYGGDNSLNGIPARWSAAPVALQKDYASMYDAGIRALSAEMDFNFGKFGLAYYLISKILWNCKMTDGELDEVRLRWLKNSFGSGWQEMKAYYDFMLLENFPLNSPNFWAEAIRYIDAAGIKIDPDREPEASARLDDLKQYWLYYYLVDTEQNNLDSADTIDFVWKGQMSYMTAMHMVVRRLSGQGRLAEILGSPLPGSPAHYSHDETEVWWSRILDHWPHVDVDSFSDAVLADGRPARDVDLNDLVPVDEFDFDTVARNPFYHNPLSLSFLTFASSAGEKIGFKLFWPRIMDDLRYNQPRSASYNLDYWDTTTEDWVRLVDENRTETWSTPLGDVWYIETTFAAPQAGTYRFSGIRSSNFTSSLAPLSFDVPANTYLARQTMTFCEPLAGGLTQPWGADTYFYIPQGITSLDLETWDDHRKILRLYKSLPPMPTAAGREIQFSRRGTHRIALDPEEAGTIAALDSVGFAFPYLYSVPLLWAKSPKELLVPRGIAEADGLTISV